MDNLKSISYVKLKKKLNEIKRIYLRKYRVDFYTFRYVVIIKNKNICNNYYEFNTFKTTCVHIY